MYAYSILEMIESYDEWTEFSRATHLQNKRFEISSYFRGKNLCLLENQFYRTINSVKSLWCGLHNVRPEDSRMEHDTFCEMMRPYREYLLFPSLSCFVDIPVTFDGIGMVEWSSTVSKL
ncbi:MAG: hypothetical protein CL759_09300 [Chloroflexi bacterium]|nr:hypothetical protein [Chloroflexota bacterium]